MTKPAETAEEHLQLDHVVGYVRGTLDSAEHARVQRHLSVCVECAREVGDVVRLSRPAARWERWRRYGPAAALAAALLLVVWTARTTGRDQGSLTRDEALTGAAAPRPLTPTVSGPGEVIFRWSPTSKADQYRLVVFDSTGSTIFEGEGAETTLGLPDSVRLAPGALYLWKVEAQTSWDRWVSSELVRFRPAGSARP
jgi:anti-sigma factor RsiW